MAHSVLLANGATKLDPPGADDLQSTGTSVDSVIVGPATDGSTTGSAVGGAGLAVSAGGDDTALAAAVATNRMLAVGSNHTAGSASPIDVASGTTAASDGMTADPATDIIAISYASVNAAPGWAGYASDAGASAAGNAAPAPGGGSLSGAGAVVAVSRSNSGVAETGLGSRPAAPAGGGLLINLVWDANALAAPQSFRDAVQSAADLLDAAIQNPITVNIEVGYGEINGQTLSGTVSKGAIGYQGKFGKGISVDFSSLRGLLASHETSIADVLSVNALPTGTSLDGVSGFTIGSAEAKALGYVVSATDPSIDGFVGFPTSYSTTGYIKAALHEITHAMGRIPGDSVLSLVRYTSPGNHDFDGLTSASYFSIDGGATKLADFGVNSDASDFQNTRSSTLTPHDPFDENIAGNGTLTSVDLAMMDVLGFQVAPTNFTVTSGPTFAGSGTTIIYSGDTYFIQSGGTALPGTLLLSGGLEVVSAGGTDSGATISGGGEQDVFGSASGAVVFNGGLQIVESGGTDTGATISSGGVQTVYGDSYGGTIDVGGNQYVESGGLAYGTHDNWNQYVYAGGETEFVSALTGDGDQYVSGGTAYFTHLVGGGGQLVYSGGLGEAADLASGGFQDVFSGGTAAYTSVGRGGSEYVYGGSATSDTIDGGSLIVSAGGSATSTTINRGLLTVSSGGIALDTAIDSGGREVVLSGGSAGFDTVNSGGSLKLSGGTAGFETISGGGRETVFAGGFSFDSLIDSGGVLTVSSGGTANSDQINSGGSLKLSGGTASSTTIEGGGSETVSAGGSATSTTINRGLLTVSSGGIALDTAIDSGGREVVLSGGSAGFDTVNSGGIERIFGMASGGAVSSGGRQIVSSGGVTRGTVLEGGTEIVYGTASGGRVNLRGIETVHGTASGGTINRGIIEVASGGTATGTVTFISGGTLQLDAGAGFAGVISGFAAPDRLDLRAIAFTSGVTTESFTQSTSSSGILTVTSGTHTAHLTLLGTYVTSQFHLGGDGHGGTRVTDPPAAAMGSSQLTFADIAPAVLLSGAADRGSPPNYLRGAIGTDALANGAGGPLLLPTRPPGGGSLLALAGGANPEPLLPPPR